MSLLISILIAVVLFMLVTKFIKSTIISISRFVFNLNTLVVGGGAAFVLYLLVLNKYHWLLSFFIGLFLIGGIKTLSDSENEIVSKMVYAIYGVADGLLVGHLVSNFALHVSYPTTKTVFAYIVSVIGMLFISYLGYYSAE